MPNSAPSQKKVKKTREAKRSTADSEEGKVSDSDSSSAGDQASDDDYKPYPKRSKAGKKG